MERAPGESDRDAERVRAPARSDPLVRTIVADWRRLTGGSSVRDGARRTLVACSGGADSSALLLALAGVSPGPEACHVVHDMRPESEAARDADRTERLCEELGITFHRVPVRVADEPGNLESNARRARYTALARVASERGLRFVATGHHADDQLETILMRLLRGAGARGVAGIRETRVLGDGVTLVRPMLGVTHAEADAMCARAGWRPNLDATNEDAARLRAALRASVLPALRAIEPEAARRVARSGRALASSADALDAWGAAVLDGAIKADGRVEIRVEILEDLPRGVLVSLVMQIYRLIVGDFRRDRLSQHQIDTCIGGLIGENGAVWSAQLAEMAVGVSAGSAVFCKKSS